MIYDHLGHRIHAGCVVADTVDYGVLVILEVGASPYTDRLRVKFMALYDDAVAAGVSYSDFGDSGSEMFGYEVLYGAGAHAVRQAR